MAIHVIVQYDSGFLPHILLLTRAYCCMVRCTFIVYYSYPFNYVDYYIVFCFVTFGGPARRLMYVYSITVGFSPTLYC